MDVCGKKHIQYTYYNITYSVYYYALSFVMQMGFYTQPKIGCGELVTLLGVGRSDGFCFKHLSPC